MIDDVKSECAFNLPQEQLRFIDGLVAAGAFASPSEVVDAGLRALRQQDDDVERWLAEDVAPVYDRMQSDPDRGVPVSKVRERLRSTHEARLSRKLDDR